MALTYKLNLPIPVGQRVGKKKPRLKVEATAHVQIESIISTKRCSSCKRKSDGDNTPNGTQQVSLLELVINYVEIKRGDWRWRTARKFIKRKLADDRVLCSNCESEKLNRAGEHQLVNL